MSLDMFLSISIIPSRPILGLGGSCRGFAGSVAFFVVVSGKVDKKSSKLLLIVVVFDPGWVNFFVEDSVVLTNGFRGLK